MELGRGKQTETVILGLGLEPKEWVLEGEFGCPPKFQGSSRSLVG
jgi:hypothetical protein